MGLGDVFAYLGLIGQRPEMSSSGVPSGTMQTEDDVSMLTEDGIYMITEDA